MKEKSKKRFSTTAFSLLITLCIYGGAVLIYFYANGWRIDPFNQEVLKTGVLTVESEPNFSNITLNGKEKGRTPKSISLDIGLHDLKVSRDGYIDWTKEIEIKEEKSTPVFPWLIRQDIKATEVFNKQGETLVKTWINKYNSHIIFLTYSIEKDSSHNYKLWDYSINRTFWSLSENPLNILTLSNENELDINLNLSNSGELALLEITNGNTDTYIIQTTKTTSPTNLEEIDLSGFNNYSAYWAQNDKYLMLESDEDLIAYDISKGTRYLLLKKDADQNYIWTTDTEGFFYTIERNSAENLENILSYKLTQKELDGSNSQTLISSIYFQENEKYINKYRDDRADSTSCICEPFTNSPECTQTVGSIQDIDVHQKAKGIYIKTTYATYWYNIETEKYLMISPYPSKLIAYSPDDDKLLFENQKGTSIFVFDKEEADHTIEIGANIVNNIKDFTKTSDFKWLSNSSYISYIEDNSLYIADKDGDNKTKLLESADSYQNIAISFSRENIITLEGITDDEGIASTIIKTYSLE